MLLFSDTFRDLRTRRRIPMRLFQEKAGVPTSYIHDIERGRVLPSLERTQELGTVFRDVAVEQRAADPEDDVRELLTARERTLLVDRLDVPPLLAELVIGLRALTEEADISPELIQLVWPLATLDASERQTLAEPLSDAVRLYQLLHVEQQRGLARAIAETTRAVEDTEPDDERPRLVMWLAQALKDALDAWELAESRPAANGGASSRDDESPASVQSGSHNS